MHKFQQLNNLFDQSENTISCDYYDLKDFQEIKIKQQDFSLLHLNISSLSCHINDLVNFLALLNTKFDVICITETRLSHKNPITTNIELPGYNTEQTPTESSAGGALIYISQNLSYKRRTDQIFKYAVQKNWNLYSLKSWFLINKVTYWVLSTSTRL